MEEFKELDLEHGQKKADKLKLTGWVRNCQDKTVECELSGKKKI